MKAKSRKWADSVVHTGLKPHDFIRAAIRHSRIETQVRMEAEAVMKQAALERAFNMRLSGNADTPGPGSWHDYWNWGEFVDDFARRSGNFASGFGDTLSSGFGLTTLFGLPSGTEAIRGLWNDTFGWNDTVDKSSGYYTGGSVTADVWLMVLSGELGSSLGSAFKSGMGRPNPAFPRGIEWVESSHWIPRRLLPDSLIKTEWNIKKVWGTTHALSDPYRYRFMRVKWKDTNKKYNQLRKHWARMPYWMQGAAIGAVTGESSRILRSNNHD